MLSYIYLELGRLTLIKPCRISTSGIAATALVHAEITQQPRQSVSQLDDAAVSQHDFGCLIFCKLPLQTATANCH